MAKASDHTYRPLVARPAKNALSVSLPERIALAVLEFITGPLLVGPRKVGKPLREPFAPAFSARRGPYRVIYLIDEGTRTVTVTAVTRRGDTYRT
jgi:mRNA interferase RelE/StbE